MVLTSRWSGINPVIWFYETLNEVQPGSGKYVATRNAPLFGWTGFLVELIWEYRYNYAHSTLYKLHFPYICFCSNWPRPGQVRKFITTTEVNIVPDVMPYPPCGDNCQNSTRLRR